MKLSEQDQKAGKLWFCIVVPVSITLAVSLFCIDRYLADPSRRDEHASTLKEVREAQIGQIWENPDARTSNSIPKP